MGPDMRLGRGKQPGVSPRNGMDHVMQAPCQWLQPEDFTAEIAESAENSEHLHAWGILCVLCGEK
jgi:hypothetical protein